VSRPLRGASPPPRPPDEPAVRMRMPDGAGTVSNTNDGDPALSKDERTREL